MLVSILNSDREFHRYLRYIQWQCLMLASESSDFSVGSRFVTETVMRRGQLYLSRHNHRLKTICKYC